MKILIEALHGLGDTVNMLPVIRAIRDEYPEAYITVLIKFNVHRELLLASKVKIDEVVVLDVHKEGAFSIYRKMSALRKECFDMSISCGNTPVRKAKLFMGVINAKRKVGIQFDQSVYFDDFCDKVHFVDVNFAAIMPILKNKEVDRAPVLYADAELMRQMRERLGLGNKRVVAMCIGQGNFSSKRNFLVKNECFTRGWGILNSIKLIKLLLKQKLKVILLGGGLEKELLKSIPQELLANPDVINLVAKTNLQESIAAAALADVVVGVDTGMMHVAGALGKRTVSIFGPTTPQVHGTYSDKAIFVEADVACKHCYGTDKYVNCEDRICLSHIAPETVKVAIDRVLG